MYFLVINLGLRSNRVAVFNGKGEKIFYDWFPVRTIMRGDGVEQDPNEWWRLTQELIKNAVKSVDIRDNLKAITVTSSACCLVCLDSRGSVLMNSLLVSDKRSVAQAKKIAEDSRFKDILSKPNNLAVASFMVPKMRWIKENREDLFGRVDKFMSSNDFLIYKLTGQFLTDTLNAEKFYYDTESGKYPREVLSLLGMESENLPRVVLPGTRTGKLTNENKKHFGIKQDVDVVISSYDAICAFWGSGASSHGEACNVCGTVSSFRVYSERDVNTNFGILSQKFGERSAYIVGGSNNIDGGLLEWAKNMFYGDSYPEKHVYNIMEDEASQADLGAENLFFIPYIMGERLPFFDTEVRGIFFGLERYHNRSHIVRSIFESSGFMVYDIMRHIEKLGLGVKDIRMSGGLARNRLACKVRADITGRRVLVVDELETTALGAFIVMAITEGIFSSFEEASKVVKYKEVYKSDLIQHAKYKRLFDFYKKIYNQNKPLFEERKELENLVNNIGKGYTLDNL